MSEEKRQAASLPETDRAADRPRWHDVGWVLLGLAADWRCAFEWSSGKIPFYSGAVIGRTVLIVVACASVSLLAICLSRTAKWRDAPGFFATISLSASYFLSVVWFGARRW